MPFASILETIGKTPMVEITRLDRGPCRLFVKLESQNPGGSIKDRIALSMIDAAARDGRLKPGGTIVEATAGNTGLGLALIAALKGYKVVLVVPDKMAREKIAHCKALGAEVRVTRSDVTLGHPEYYQDMAKRIAKEIGGFFVNQFDNPANPEAHVKTTGPEIWEQMEHKIDAIVCGVGSGGTMAGLARYFSSVSPGTEMILADPKGSILEPLINCGEKITPGSWEVEGIGEDFVPPNLDIKVVRKAYSITDAESLQMARELLRQEGILAGSSSGTLMAAALRYCREQKVPKRVVTLICDQGGKYLSKLFNDIWMVEQSFIHRPETGTLEDLVIRRHASGDAVVARPDDTLQMIYKRMRAADVSQIPVLDNQDQVIGLIREETIFHHATEASGAPAAHKLFTQPAKDVMDKAYSTAEKHMPLAEAVRILQKEPLIIVTDGKKFAGVVTRIDVLNHWSQLERKA